MTPLWEVLGALVPPQPRSPVQPALWRYAELREQVMEAGRLITRRGGRAPRADPGEPGAARAVVHHAVAVCRAAADPAGRGRAGASPHQSALRLVLDGEGAYTAVDGERTTMRRGDFIITPAWTWHDHGNLGDQPVVWLDGLDIPIVRFLDAGFAEKSEQPSQQPLRPEGDALARYGINMVPVDYRAEAGRPDAGVRLSVRAHARQSLLAIARGTPDAHHGFKLRYVNPATGASPMPTIGAFAQWLPAGFETQALSLHRRHGATCAWKAAARRASATQPGASSENDVFVVPSWHALQLRADRDALLFSFSDRPVQQALGLWREAARFDRHDLLQDTAMKLRHRGPAAPTLSIAGATSASRSTALLRRPQLRRPRPRDGQGPGPRAAVLLHEAGQRRRRRRATGHACRTRRRRRTTITRSSWWSRSARAAATSRVADALEHVYGYAVGLDMTRRDLQLEARDKGRPWEFGKSFAQSAPIGALHRVEDIGHPASAAITLHGQRPAAPGVRHRQADLVGGRVHRLPLRVRDAGAGRPHHDRHARGRERGGGGRRDARRDRRPGRDRGHRDG